jgi:hypothetical protein
MGGTALAHQRVISVEPRTYLHLDSKLSQERAEAFSFPPQQVLTHSFLPFVGFDRVARRIDFDSEPHWKIEPKRRPIRYASHTDSAIHALYATKLGEHLECKLAELGVQECCLAYRSGIGSNITFAKHAVDEIRQRGNCVALCFDVSKFFDSLDHEKLERALIYILGTDKLSKDWLRIFARLTKFEWVDVKDLRQAVPQSVSPGRLCSIHQFRRYGRALMNKNTSDVGIPQGSPLSGVLANAYMLKFDTKMCTLSKTLGGSYRRYSDDIVIILPNHEHADAVEQAVNIMLLDIGLCINPEKTKITRFIVDLGIQGSVGDQFQYLGFTFDGVKLLIRPSSLKNFYSRMKAAIRISVRSAYHAGYPRNEIRRRTIVGRFTHWGDRRNFVQYAYRASRIMNAPEIRRQLRNHSAIFKRTFEKYVERHYGIQ